MVENAELFRQEYPLPDGNRPAWGELLAVMRDVPAALTEPSRPFGRHYDENAYDLRSVIDTLVGESHSREAVLWALDLLMEWRCLECRTIRWVIGDQNQHLPEDIAAHIRESGTHQAAPSLGFTAIAPTDDLSGWPSFARVYISANPDNADQSPNDNWPPAVGWGFRVGEFAYNGCVHELAGKKRELLQFFAENVGSTRRWTISEIKREVWDDDFVEDNSVRSTISTLRNLLRRVLDLPQGWDPIPAQDRGYRLNMPPE